MSPAGPELFDYYAAMSAAAEVVTGVQFHATTITTDATKMAEMLGKPPEYTDKGRQLRRHQVQVSGGRGRSPPRGSHRAFSRTWRRARRRSSAA